MTCITFATLRGVPISSAMRITEVENPGRSDESEKQPGQDGGYLWRMETWWRMEERDGGVYVQSEVASLKRDIPTGLGWLVGPFVTGIPKETLLSHSSPREELLWPEQNIAPRRDSSLTAHRTLLFGILKKFP
jgi:hypothetical protein